MKEIKDINERLDGNEEIINNLVKKTMEMEKQLAHKPEIIIPDYSGALEFIISTIKELKEDYSGERQMVLLNAMKEKLDSLPKSATKQLRILLFPETNQGEYYKIVFGRLIPWGLCFIIATYIFVMAYKGIEAYRYNEDVSQSTHYEKAWLYLKQHSKKKTVAAMDDAFKNTMEK